MPIPHESGRGEAESPDRPSGAEEGTRGLQDPAVRRRLARRAALYSWGLYASAVAVALGGAAILAWWLAPILGVPFLRAWLLGSAFLLGLPLVAHALLRAWQARRGR